MTAFHHSVAQLLFEIMRGRKDTETSIYLLTTRVQEPDNYYWRKLQQILQDLRRTIYIPLIVRPEILNVVKWWVDYLYSVCGDMRGHTGGTMSLGHGSEIILSKKPNINMWSRILFVRITLYQVYTV